MKSCIKIHSVNAFMDDIFGMMIVTVKRSNGLFFVDSRSIEFLRCLDVHRRISRPDVDGMVITLCHYSGYLDHGQVFALLDCLREVGQHVLADVEAGEEGEAGHGGGDAAQLIVSKVQLLQAVTVEQGPGVNRKSYLI